MNEIASLAEPGRWKRANRQHIELELARLRLLLQRRALWLRRQWAHDSSQDYMAWRISEAQADWLLRGENRAAEAAFYAEDADAVALASSLELGRGTHRGGGRRIAAGRSTARPRGARAPVRIEPLRARCVPPGIGARARFVVRAAVRLSAGRFDPAPCDGAARADAVAGSRRRQRRRARMLLPRSPAAPLPADRDRRHGTGVGISQPAGARRRAHARLRARHQPAG